MISGYFGGEGGTAKLRNNSMDCDTITECDFRLRSSYKDIERLALVANAFTTHTGKTNPRIEAASGYKVGVTAAIRNASNTRPSV